MIAVPHPSPRRFLLRSLLGLGLWFTAGCSIIPEPAPDPTRFYVLTGPGLPGEVSTPHGTLRLGLHTVELSSYLKSRSLIVRNGRNEIVYQDYARWAEPLEAGIARVLRARLSVAPEVSRVYSQPFPFDRDRDFDVSINVIRCEGVREGDKSVARFAAVVEILHATSGDVASRRTVVTPELPWDGQDYSALAEALSEAVGQLAHQLVDHLPAPSAAAR